MRLEYFEMLDRVHVLDLQAQKICCTSTIPMISPVFEGHFPTYPIVPGVLLIEIMAQAAGYLSLTIFKFKKMPFLANITEAKLRSFLAPGATIDITASLIHQGSGFTVVTSEIESEGNKICRAEIMLRLLPFPNHDFAAIIRRRAIELGVDANFIE
jgi:3-hydroxyacyl-[acyl-carrier-protein] dehydratase